MARVYEKWYRQGRYTDIAPGQSALVAHPIGSFDVALGKETLTVFAGTTDDGRAPILYDGEMEAYHDFKYMGHAGNKLVQCGAIDIDPDASMTLAWRHQWSNGHYDTTWKLPPGEYPDAIRYFPNDRIQSVTFGAAGQVEVFEHGGYGGRHVALGPGAHDLHPYGLADQASSLKYTLDGWTEQSMRFGAIRNKRQIGQAIADSITLTNEHPSIAADLSQTLSSSEQAAYTFDWSATAGITTSASVKLSTGALPGGEVTAGVEAQASTTAGESHSTLAEQAVSGTATAKDIPPGGRVTLELLVRRYLADVDVIRVMRNDRTGQTVEQVGSVPCPVQRGRGARRRVTAREELEALKEARRLVDEAEAVRAAAWERVAQEFGGGQAIRDHAAAVGEVQRLQAALDSISRNVRVRMGP